MLNIRQGPSGPTPTFGPGPIIPNPSPPLSDSSLSISLETTASVSVLTETIDGQVFTVTIPSSSTGSGASSSSIASSSSTPSPTQGGLAPTPSWIFTTPTNATTCEPLQINWSISTPASPDLSSVQINLLLNNASVIPEGVNMTLATDQSLLSETYKWPVVTVPPGAYIIQSSNSDGTGSTVQSSTFSVQAGTNISCLPRSNPGSQIGTSNLSSTSKGARTGAIAGGTIGGFVLFACVGMALFYFLAVRNKPRSKRNRGVRRGWGGLGSVDSKPPISRDAPGESNDHLGGLGAAVQRHESSSSVNDEKDPRQSGSSGGLPASLELTRLSSRPQSSISDSPRTSTDFTNTDPFASTPHTNNRRASRTPRKPVPAYNLTPEEIDAMAMARTRSDQSYSRSSVSQQASSNFTQARSFSPSSSAVSHHGEALLHDLKSKSSGHFNGQPVHYLMPDMPPASSTD